MSSNLRSVRNVGADITFLYRKPELMLPILPQNRNSRVTHQCPRLCPHMLSVCLFSLTIWWIEEMWLSPLNPLINVQLLCWRWATEEESTSVVRTTHLRELHVKSLRVNCIMESTVPFLDWNSLRAGTYCLTLQAVLTQNLPSKPITHCSQSDIHKKFSILSF